MGAVKVVLKKERIATLDVLRGLTILGILIPNLLIFAGFFDFSRAIGTMHASIAPGQWFEHGAVFFTNFLINEKLFLLLAFLFGVGFSIMSRSLAKKGVSPNIGLLTRFSLLLLIGLVLTLLFWSGEVLRYYALAGIALIFFHKMGNKSLLITAGMMFLLPIGVKMLDIYPAELISYYARGGAYQQDLGTIFVEGSLSQTISANIQQAYGQATMHFASGRMFKVMAMALLGLYVGRNQLMSQFDQHKRLLKLVLLLGFTVGVLGNLLRAVLDWTGAFSHYSGYPLFLETLRAISVPAMSLFYAAIVVVATNKQQFQRLFAFATPIGKMALSNYVFQLAICAYIFRGFGLGLYQQLSISQCLVLVACIWTVQYLLSRAWLVYLKQGPVEWLWRNLGDISTYQAAKS